MFRMEREVSRRPEIDEPTRLRRIEVERSLAELRHLGLVSSTDESLAEAVARAAEPGGARPHVMAVRSLAVTRYFVTLRPGAA